MYLNERNDVIIVGAGIAGLTVAIAISLAMPKRKIPLVDSSANAGGSFSSLEVDEGCFFDRGIHLIPHPRESLFEFLFTPENGFGADYWNVLSFPRSDRSGNFINGVFNFDSSLININNLGCQDAAIIRAELDVLLPKSQDSCRSVGEYIDSNFGARMLSLLDNVILAKFGRKAYELNPNLLNLYPLKRIIVDGQVATEALLSNSRYASRIGYPRQEKLPPSLAANPLNYYPKTAGIKSYIDRMIAFLRNRGVDIFFESQVVELLSGSNSNVTGLTIRRRDGSELKFTQPQIIWSSPAFFLHRLLTDAGITIPAGIVSQRPERVIDYVHFCTERPLVGMDVFYIYPFTPDHFFRLTNYASFTKHPMGNAYTLELIRAFDSDPLSLLHSRSAVVKFLAAIGRKHVAVTHCWSDPYRAPVPTATLDNIAGLGTGAQLKAATRSVHSNSLAGIELFGSAATGQYMVSKDVFSAAAKFAKEMQK